MTLRFVFGSLRCLNADLRGSVAKFFPQIWARQCASDGRGQENALSTSPTDLGGVTSIASDSPTIVGTRTPFATPGRIDSQTQLKAACDFLRSSMQKFVTVLPEIPLDFQAHNLRKGQLRTRSPQEDFNGCP